MSLQMPVSVRKRISSPLQSCSPVAADVGEVRMCRRQAHLGPGLQRRTLDALTAGDVLR